MKKLRVLSLFSGIGGIDLGLERSGMKIVGQIEIEDFPTKILKKHWPKVARWRDIRHVTTNDIRRRCGRVDVICGGFPCQDISTAGKGAGIVDGERSGLWREMWRLIRDVRPAWLLIENVPALKVRGADGVLAALESIGYTCWPSVVGAWAVGAPHQRNRVWIVGYSNRRRQQGGAVSAKGRQDLFKSDRTSAGLANANGESRRTSRTKTGDAMVEAVSICQEFKGCSELEHPESQRYSGGGVKRR